ncbi:hypothetical protein, conserved, partial [Eimeria tenella]
MAKKHEKGLCTACRALTAGRRCHPDHNCLQCHHSSHLTPEIREQMRKEAEAIRRQVAEQHAAGKCEPCVSHFAAAAGCGAAEFCCCCHDPQHAQQGSPQHFLALLHQQQRCLPCAPTHSGEQGCPGPSCSYCHHPSHGDKGDKERHFSVVLHKRK